jgi:uncharacterized protein (DUF433 family)
VNGRIVIDPQVMGGRPCIRGTRVTVSTVLRALGEVGTKEELLALYPYLTREDIDAALEYAAWRASEQEAEIPAA